MIKILLADDNKLSLQYFSEMLSWNDYGYTLVSTAVDGENAWYDFQKYKPDVIIADIQMPILSGIDLAKKVLAAAPDTIFLFLSSYKEFQYARAALQLKVYDYLLKHETTPAVLGRKLEEISQHLAHEKKKKRLLVKEELHSFFLLEPEPLSHPEPAYLTDKYDCFFLERSHAFPFFTDKLKKYYHHEPHSNDISFQQYCSVYEGAIAASSVSDDQLLLLTRPNENPYDFCCQIQRKLAEQLKCSISIAIVKKEASVSECASAFRQTRPRLNQLYFYPPSAVIDSSYLTEIKPSSDNIDFTKEVSHINKNTLSILEQQYNQSILSKDYSAFCRVSSHWLEALLYFDQRIIHPATGQIVSFFSDRDPQLECDVNAFYRWIHKKITYLTEIFALYNYTECSSMVREAIYIISCNYSNYDLNVEWIAEKLKISLSGLNVLFKRETGHTPWKIIINTRLCHACRLLEQGNSTMEQICIESGYNSLSYFSKSFKKVYGITPQEYRRNKLYQVNQT